MPVSEILQDAEIEHQLDLVKYGNDRSRSLLVYLREIVDYIETRLAKEGESIQSKKRLNILLADVNEKLNSIYSKWEVKEFEPIIPAVAKQEIAFQASAVDSVVVGYESVKPSVKQVESAAFNNPLLIGSKGGAVDFSKYTKNWKPNEIQRVASRISAGFYAGETTSQIARAVNGLKSRNYADGIMNISRANIQGMIKNTINHMSVQAKESFNKDNSDLIIGYEIVATLDSLTCLAKGEKVLMASGDYLEIEKVKVGDKVIGGSGLPRAVTGTLKTQNKQLLRVHLENGKFVTCTYDHLWLTHNRGWVMAGELTNEDDIAELPDMRH